MRKILTLLVIVVCSIVANAQTRIISGRVTDQAGAAVPSASVVVKGTRTGVSATANGDFKINVKTGDILVITAVNFTTVDVKVGSQNTISAVLIAKETQIDEVVVTALGVKKSTKELGYATQKINSQELIQAHVTNVASGLTGKVSGLQIQTTNNGVDPSIRINLRGNRSILGNNQALLVVDGAIVPSGFLSSINADDIESINVLKGVAASTLYGSDGSNGVLVVTTKKAVKGKLQVKFSSNIQFENLSIMPDLQTDYGSYGGEGGQYIDPVTGKVNYVPFENQSFGPRYDGSMVALGTPKRMYRPDGTFYDSTLMVPYTGLKDAKRKFWSTGLTTQNDLSVSSGDDKGGFFLGLQNVYNTGIVPGDNSYRNSVRINGFREYDQFKVEYSVGYTQTEKDLVGAGFFQSRPLYFAVLNTPAHVDLRQFQDTWSVNSFGNVNNYFNAYYPNPWWQINNARTKTRKEALIANLNASLKLTNWLDASYRLGYTSTAQLFKSTTNGVQYSAYEITDPYGVSNLASSVKKTNASESDGTSFQSKITGDLLVTIHKTFKNFSPKLLLGHSIQMDYYNALGASASALTFNNFYNIGTRLGNPTVNQGVFERNIQGAFADGSVGFKNYLFLHGAYRNSWYSTLPASNRRFSYGGADISFILSDAIPTLFTNKLLNFAKIRASYGSTGQLSLDNLSTFGTYLTSNTFATAGGFPYGNVAGYALSTTNNNPNIKDERTSEIELGIELGFLKNRINLQGAIYKQKTKNQTLPSQVSWATGFSSNLINDGTTQNVGVEADLKLTPILTNKGLRWDIGFNFNYIQNKVVALPGGADVSLGNSSYAIVGYAFPSLKVYDWNRDPITNKVIVDENGDPSRSSTIKQVGSAYAPYRVGVTSSLSYKGLSLSLVADYRGGGIIFNQIGQDLDFSGISAHSTYGNREKFVFPNSVYDDGTATGKYVTNSSRTISNVYNFWSGNINRIGTPYVTSNSFWKLRELALNYSIPSKILSKTKVIKGATIGMFGRNLLTWRPKENIWTDPEFNDNAANNDAGFTSANQTPPTRFWGFNLSLNF